MRLGTGSSSLPPLFPPSLPPLSSPSLFLPSQIEADIKSVLTQDIMGFSLNANSSAKTDLVNRLQREVGFCMVLEAGASIITLAPPHTLTPPHTCTHTLTQYHCCGVCNYSDWRHFNTTWNRETEDRAELAPQSCCMQEFIDSMNCTNDPSTLYDTVWEAIFFCLALLAPAALFDCVLGITVGVCVGGAQPDEASH